MTEGLKIPKGEQAPSGRQLVIQKDQETVYLIDTDINVLKAQLIYNGLFPAPVISRPAPPLPSEQDLSLVIDALKTKHRGTADLENVLNRVTGRVRDQDDQYSDNQDRDRMKTRFTGDTSSGNLVMTSPREYQSDLPPSTGQTSRPVDRYQSASVEVGQARVPKRERFRRFGKMDFAQLSAALGEKGRLKVLHERSHNLLSKRALALSAGPVIPFIHYQPDASEGDYKPQSAKVGLTLNVVPIRLSKNIWQVSIITELVDFLRYPTVEKNYLEFSSIIHSGDTLVFKKMVPEEISGDSRIGADVTSAAETLILLTLKEK